MGLFDFLSTPDPSQAAMTQGDQNNQGSNRGILASMTPDQGQMLMAMGQGLLSQRGFGPGLAAGFQGAGDVAQQQQKLQAQKEQNDILNKIRQQNANTGQASALAKIAKLQQDMAGGNVKSTTKIGDDSVLITYTDGTTETITNKDMQEAGMRMNNGKLERAQTMQQYKYDNAPLTAAEQKLSDERKDGLAGVQTTKNDVADLISFGDKMKPGIGSQLAGTGIGKAAAALGSGYSEDAANASQYQQKLSSVLTNKWLDIGAKLKGAQSDAEGRQLLSTLPDPKADYQTVIRPWLVKYQAWLDDTEKKATEKLSTPRVPETATGSGTSSAPAASGLPGLSPKASRYFQ